MDKLILASKTFAIFATIFIFVIILDSSRALAGPSHNISGYAWSSNIGWISFNDTNTGSGGGNYGVNMDGSGRFSGYAWSSNIGWIDFSGVSLNGTTLQGFARALSGSTANSGGWDGFISMSGGSYAVTKNGNIFEGFAWGSDVVGWVQFNTPIPVTHTPPPDPFNYSLRTSGDITVIQGGSGQNTIFADLISGAPQSVNFSFSGTPLNINSYAIPNNPCTPTPNSCSTTFTINTSPTTPVGTYTVTFTGQPLGKTTSFNLIVLTPLAVTCSANITSATTGQIVTWTASPSGGTGTYTYLWSGTDSLSGTSQSVNKTYATTGTKTALVTVTSNTQTITQSIIQLCNNSVIVAPFGKIQSKRVDVNFNPLPSVLLPASTSWLIDDGATYGRSSSINDETKSDIPTGIRKVSVTNIIGYTEKFNVCTYPVTGSECHMTILNQYTNNGVTCDSILCSVNVNVADNVVTKVVFLYESAAPPPAPPTINLSATPASVNYGGSTLLSWSTSNATSCSATGSWSGVKLLNGTETRSNLISNQSFTLDCTGPGGSATSTVSVTVAPAPTLSVTLTTAPSSGTAPLNGVTLTANVSGTATGPITYEFDCRDNGTIEYTTTTSLTPFTATDLNNQPGTCAYQTAGAYRAYVRVTRENVQATGRANITVTNAPVAAICSPSSSSVSTGQLVTWTASPSGGTGTYTYLWSGTDSLSGTLQSVDKTYGTTGIKSAQVRVTSGVESITRQCGSVNVSLTPPPTHSVTVTKNDPNAGAVASNDGGSTISCLIGCGSVTRSISEGTTITLVATPAIDFVFGAWTGCDTTSANTCVVNVNGVESISARFDPVPLPIPDAPFINASPATCGGRINIAWTRPNWALPGDTVTYNLYRDSGPPSAPIVANISFTIYGDTGLAPDSDHQYAIEAIVNGKKSALSPWQSGTATAACVSQVLSCLPSAKTIFRGGRVTWSVRTSDGTSLQNRICDWTGAVNQTGASCATPTLPQTYTTTGTKTAFVSVYTPDNPATQAIDPVLVGATLCTVRVLGNIEGGEI